MRLLRQFRAAGSLLAHCEMSVRQLIKSHSELVHEQIDLARPFDELGIGPLERTRLVVEAEVHFGLDFSEQEFLGIVTPFDLVVLVNKHRARHIALVAADSLKA